MSDHFTEHRALTMVDVELDGMDFVGKAAVFDTPWDEALTAKLGYEEIVKRGAFTPAIKASGSIPFLREHDPQMLLGTTHAGTMTVAEDGDALVVHAKLPPTALGEETRALIDRGDLRGMSYGVESVKSGSRMFRNAAGGLVRAVHEFRRMLDVSITYSPAYPNTSAELRSFTAVSLEDLGEDAAFIRVSSDRAARIRAAILQTHGG